MAKRVSARCASCRRKGRPRQASDYVCKRCRDGAHTRVPSSIAVEDYTEQMLSAIRHDALANSKGVPMAKKQTRKSVSVKGLTEQRLKNHCRELGRSVSGYLEELIVEKLDEANAPVVTEADLPPEPPEPPPEPYARDWDLPLLL